MIFRHLLGCDTIVSFWTGWQLSAFSWVWFLKLYQYAELDQHAMQGRLTVSQHYGIHTAQQVPVKHFDKC